MARTRAVRAEISSFLCATGALSPRNTRRVPPDDPLLYLYNTYTDSVGLVANDAQEPGKRTKESGGSLQDAEKAGGIVTAAASLPAVSTRRTAGWQRDRITLFSRFLYAERNRRVRPPQVFVPT